MSQLVKKNVKLILKILSDLEPLRGSSNKKTLYSTRSCVNWAFFGTRGPLKRSFHSRFKLADSCQKRPNLHTNSLNKLPGDQDGLFKLAIQLRTFFYSAIYNTATGYVLWVYLTDI
jgi:hypothetical protein